MAATTTGGGVHAELPELSDLLRAGRDCVTIFGAFATLTIVAIAFWFAPSRELRLLPTLLVLGPLTLVRPLVIVGGLAFAAIRTPTPRVWIAAFAAAASMLAVEHLLARRHTGQWRGLIAAEPPPGMPPPVSDCR